MSTTKEKQCNCEHFQKQILNATEGWYSTSVDWHCPVHGMMHKDFSTTNTSDWEKEFYERMPPRGWLGENGDESEMPEGHFGYKILKGDEIFTITDWGNIKSFIAKEIERAREEGRQSMQEIIQIYGYLPSWAIELNKACNSSPHCSHNTNGRDLNKPCSIQA